jgi:hypothetical protein
MCSLSVYKRDREAGKGGEGNARGSREARIQRRERDGEEMWQRRDKGGVGEQEGRERGREGGKGGILGRNDELAFPALFHPLDAWGTNRKNKYETDERGNIARLLMGGK